MKRLSAIGLLLAGVAHADMFRPYDGDGTTPMGTYSTQQGMTCAYYNTAGGIRWENKGGDWLDAAGTPQGTLPFSSKRFAATTNAQVVELDATGLLSARGIILRRSGGAVVRVAMRESATPPILSVALLDGTTVDLVPYADVGLSWAQQGTQCNEWAGGSAPSSPLPYAMMMAFDVPAGAVSAVLKVTILSAGGAGDLQAFALRTPVADATAVVPFVPTEDPITHYFEPWERENGAPPMDWWSRMGSSQAPDASWTHENGMFPSPGSRAVYWANGDPAPITPHDCEGLTVQRGLGKNGPGLGWTNSCKRLAHGTDLAQKIRIAKMIGQELEEAWLTYDLKLTNWRNFAKCEGGKLPGLTGRTDYCAGSSVAANGLCGWSLRMAYKMQCDPRNPAWGKAIIYAYPYHGLMPGYYGSTWELSPDGMLNDGEWACVEQHLKVNTPGVADGVLQVYINGRLALDKRDVYLRAARPEQGYGNWWHPHHKAMPAGAETFVDTFGRTLWLDRGRSATGLTIPLYSDSSLGIDGVYFAIHNGGVTPVGFPPDGKVGQGTIDNVRVSERRAGCATAEASPPPPPPPPPPVEVCGDGLDNDGNGQTDEGCTPPPPPPTELELAQAALAKALSDLGEAQARITVLESLAEASATQIDELRAAANAAEAQATAASATIQTIRDLVREP